MDFTKYENKMQYPSQLLFKEEISKVEETFVGTKLQIESEVERVKKECKEKAREMRDKWNAEAARLEALFRDDLEKEFEVVGNPKAYMLYRIAYEQGHDSGYESIYSIYEELVVLIK
jgi:hypothetical protein